MRLELRTEAGTRPPPAGTRAAPSFPRGTPAVEHGGGVRRDRFLAQPYTYPSSREGRERKGGSEEERERERERERAPLRQQSAGCPQFPKMRLKAAGVGRKSAPKSRARRHVSWRRASEGAFADAEPPMAGPPRKSLRAAQAMPLQGGGGSLKMLLQGGSRQLCSSFVDDGEAPLVRRSSISMFQENVSRLRRTFGRHTCYKCLCISMRSFPKCDIPKHMPIR